MARHNTHGNMGSTVCDENMRPEADLGLYAVESEGESATSKLLAVIPYWV